eukprot:14139325-Alexandrium_andersonii.AAC.1
MSASLVGSEMCIRDRASALTHARALARILKRKCQQESKRAQHGEGTTPVSYTHLTLPTICSV